MTFNDFNDFIYLYKIPIVLFCIIYVVFFLSFMHYIFEEKKTRKKEEHIFSLNLTAKWQYQEQNIFISKFSHWTRNGLTIIQP